MLALNAVKFRAWPTILLTAEGRSAWVSVHFNGTNGLYSRRDTFETNCLVVQLVIQVPVNTSDMNIRLRCFLNFLPRAYCNEGAFLRIETVF